MEQKFASLKTDLAIYFAHISAQLKYLLKNVALTSTNTPSALQQLYNSVAADNFQITSTNTATSNIASTKMYNIVVGHFLLQMRVYLVYFPCFYARNKNPV